jgi:hypothetical protein
MSSSGQDADRAEPAPRSRPPQPDAEAALAAMSELLAAAEQMEQVIAVVRDRTPAARACIAEGLPFGEIVTRMERPLVGEVLYDALDRFEAAGTRCRRVLATALRREGRTMQQIGDLWGISRQRVSELLQDADRRSDR